MKIIVFRRFLKTKWSVKMFGKVVRSVNDRHSNAAVYLNLNIDDKTRRGCEKVSENYASFAIYYRFDVYNIRCR